MIHPRVLYEVREQISGVLKHIFVASLRTSELPDDWKSSIVSVIFKKGSRTSVSNYRPISLTCIVCKILESFLRDHIMEYFLSNKLFSVKQYGFIQGRSTTLQLLNILDNWTKCMELGGQKVPHRRLMSKLQSYGINSQSVKWIDQFLCYRRHKVKINGKSSEWSNVTSGVTR